MSDALGKAAYNLHIMGLSMKGTSAAEVKNLPSWEALSPADKKKWIDKGRDLAKGGES